MTQHHAGAAGSPVERLGLAPHPEGGYYRQTWASPVEVELPDGRRRPTATLIYFFLPAGAASAWHVVRSAEHWIANQGEIVLELAGDGPAPDPDSVVRHVIAPDGSPQLSIPAGVWQRTVPAAHDALASCMVSPGFDFEDFELEPGASSAVA